MGDELLKLADRVEAATEPDRELDEAIAAAVEYAQLRNGFLYAWCAAGSTNELISPSAYTASLDAAMTLVPEGADWYVTSIRPLTDRFAGAVYDGPHPKTEYAEAQTPARALAAAALRARAALAQPSAPLRAGKQGEE